MSWSAELVRRVRPTPSAYEDFLGALEQACRHFRDAKIDTDLGAGQIEQAQHALTAMDAQEAEAGLGQIDHLQLPHDQLTVFAAELQEARMRLVDHVENSPLAVIEWDPDFRVLRWAGQAATTFGWTAEETVGKHYSDWPFIHPDDLASVRKFMLQTAQLGWLNHELVVESSNSVRKMAATSQELSASSARLEETIRQLSETLNGQLKELATRLDSIQGKIQNIK